MDVLHIDDNYDFLCLTKYFLEKINKRLCIESCTSPLNAIQLIQQKSYTVIISDYKMPQMTGLELVHLLKMVQPDLKIILLSWLADTDILVQIKQQGIYRIIAKQVNIPESFLQLHQYLLSLELEVYQFSSQRNWFQNQNNRIK